ncbi:MAG: hypothetical protein K0Q50_1936 [Vampirovibrio sp.]|jgi:hypothetical protein|nr:hypothetical protein [Vampirovibrio sp.]
MGQQGGGKAGESSKRANPNIHRGIPAEEKRHSSIELDEDVSVQAVDMNLGGKRLGGPTGGDFAGGGGGPALGETHPADEETADHYGSREETRAALEEKIATQNALKLHDQF